MGRTLTGKSRIRKTTPSNRHQAPRTRRGQKKLVEKSSKVVTITLGVPGLEFLVLFVVVRL